MKALPIKLMRLFSKKRVTATIANDDQRGAIKATSFDICDRNGNPRGVWVDLPLRQKHIKIEKTNKTTGCTGNTQAGYCPKMLRINVAGNLIVRY